ncbi:Molybdopterin molybdenumtransferase [Roseivivax sp. THAF40]|uniref:molybdopterin molybdotransferase MoeA n=1 Tax=unclassified Roseivivax TaxID=2639302 RepID=UPI001268FB3D|nr:MULTISPECIES: gephyrin-like molybdotransferase Glp [unclassified Roseivivax]QFS83376.1 Molybdopterin molybdenumtransferase [Roseivivax sp. THAF197b]QFT47120.1 Molybdopterin molybdenumtransferase [Roseivivax sp. THAF40]
MISVETALDALFALTPVLETEPVALRAAAGRVLREDAVAERDQPPFPASAMDGYAVMAAAPGDRFEVIGTAVAGKAFGGTVGPRQAVRIFTGAPVPDGAARIIIQEDVTRSGDTITVADSPDRATYIRPAGNDFTAGARIDAPRILRSGDIALLAAMNVSRVIATRKPRVAIIATGDELVSPGEVPGPDQIVASNTYGLAALFESVGAETRLLPIARDDHASLATVLGLVDDADLVVTVGGASVGDHDLVAEVSQNLGLERSFYKVAMRPGKPLMAGRLGQAMMIGLPGNPVSAMVCGHVFVIPVLRAMQGLGASPAPRLTAPLAHPLEPNGPRAHYMRARLKDGTLEVFERQDSGLLSVLNAADALVVRSPNAAPADAGESVPYLPL